MNYLEELFKSGVWGTKPPKEPRWIKWVHRYLSDNHCEECLKLDGCWFSEDIMPKLPHHPFCHCIKDSLPYSLVLNHSRAISAYTKFDPYLFNSEYAKKHGKDKMLRSWGYTASDSKYLQEECEKQGLKKYIDGDYELGYLNQYGQRISIRIEIPRKDTGELVSFITGWMVLPDGQIKLNTPYGGK